MLLLLMRLLLLMVLLLLMRHPTFDSRCALRVSTDKKHGIPIWGVTVQNEAEAADVGWEKCVWTPQFQAQFVADHLGPVLHADHPGTKIIAFDHNKDHVAVWASAVYANEKALWRSAS